MASSKEDFPAPLAPEMQASAKLVKSTSTGSWYERKPESLSRIGIMRVFYFGKGFFNGFGFCSPAEVGKDYIVAMPPLNRIVVVGTTGSGKSTLAQQLAKKLGHDFVELDALYWEANWQPTPPEVFYARVETATQGASWVVAGNYSVVRPLIWDRADTIIWLDYPFGFTFGRLWAREWRRWFLQEELWHGNRQSIWTHLQLWSEKSLFHWFFKSYTRRKREFEFLFTQPAYAPKALRFTSQQSVDAWLEKLKK